MDERAKQPNQRTVLEEASLVATAGAVASSGVLRRRPSSRRLPGGDSGGVVADAIVYSATGPNVEGEPILGLDSSEAAIPAATSLRDSTSAQPQWTRGSRRRAREPEQEAATSLAGLEAVAGAEAVDALSVTNEKTGLPEATPPISEHLQSLPDEEGP
ncbi:hypothetical protein THAOC_07777 [Thalassiosira oceanica]|uniref:Uncharacterized protein n=1 Tax=Thalassiosira oceanica TaxID=159749 RepID=K0TBM6_THAOC|nr:hypothetical protein THAOC_07777 [Thalassiosira oceanica]|eukprot:EJK70836.1 hypothetical protein THAOC_07777 [Thalassiosira oceanica]